MCYISYLPNDWADKKSNGKETLGNCSFPPALPVVLYLLINWADTKFNGKTTLENVPALPYSNPSGTNTVLLAPLVVPSAHHRLYPFCTLFSDYNK